MESNQQADAEANWLHHTCHFLQFLQMAEGSKKAQDAIRTCGERDKKARKGTSASAGIVVPSARRRLRVLYTDWVKERNCLKTTLSLGVAFTLNSIILRGNDALFQTCTEESSLNLSQTQNNATLLPTRKQYQKHVRARHPSRSSRPPWRRFLRYACWHRWRGRRGGGGPNASGEVDESGA